MTGEQLIHEMEWAEQWSEAYGRPRATFKRLIPVKVIEILVKIKDRDRSFEKATDIIQKIERYNWTADISLDGEIVNVRPMKRKRITRKPIFTTTFF